MEGMEGLIPPKICSCPSSSPPKKIMYLNKTVFNYVSIKVAIFLRTSRFILLYAPPDFNADASIIKLFSSYQ